MEGVKVFTERYRHSVTRAAGPLLFAMVLLTVLHGVWPVLFSAALPLAGLFAWIAAALLFFRLRWVQKLQISLFLAVGFGFIALAPHSDLVVTLTTAATRNTGLVTMLLSVGFLKLVLLPDPADDPAAGHTDTTLPVGRRAYLHTLLTTALFGSIINISAPVIIGDRLTAQRP